jgi:hypothetical protein
VANIPVTDLIQHNIGVSKLWAQALPLAEGLIWCAHESTLQL